MNDQSKRELGQIRREYNRPRLDEETLPEDPLEVFERWMEEARSTSNPDPTAMTLSTVGSGGHPSSRMVLLKDITDDKLVFFSNYLSRKGREIAVHPHVAAHFYWPELERQVRIEGMATPISEEKSIQYFRSRPFESNIGAWASSQSEVIPHRRYLEEEFEKYRMKFRSAGEVTKPVSWGGYAINPDRMEFWQGGKHRLHDRIEYRKQQGRWSRVRLAP
jgi:pyridoxamine 5'-phosphate oxidase